MLSSSGNNSLGTGTTPTLPPYLTNNVSFENVFYYVLSLHVHRLRASALQPTDLPQFQMAVQIIESGLQGSGTKF